ncbi:MAG: QueT transporter family protein [Oscillospiraceae bacterium]
MKNSISEKTKKLSQIAMIAAIYAAISFAMFFISFGQIQFRVSEMLTILPVFTGMAVPGLTLGCVISNLVGFFCGANPLGLIDAIVGSTATLISAILTYYIGKSDKKWIKYIFAPLPPVIVNAIIIGFEVTFAFNGINSPTSVYLTNMGLILLGQATICYGVGVPLMMILQKNNLWQKIFSGNKKIL